MNKDSILGTLEEILFEDKTTIRYKSKARSLSLRMGLPILEPPKSKVSDVGEFKTSHDETNDRLQLESFTVSLPPSSTIQTATYWPKKNYLITSFKSGASYDYKDVPQSIIRAWIRAKSAGSFFYYNIRTSFKYTKI